MVNTYTLSSGQKIQVEEISYCRVEVRGIYETELGRVAKKSVYINTSNTKKYIVWNREVVYLDNYDSMSLQEFNDKAQLGNINNQDIIRTITRLGSDKIGVVLRGSAYNIKSGKKVIKDVLYKIDESVFKVEDDYKLWLTPIIDTYRKWDLTKILRMQDIVTMLNNKHGRLVDIQEEIKRTEENKILNLRNKLSIFGRSV